MGKIPCRQVFAKDVLNSPVNKANEDQFLTLSLKRKPGSPLPPVFPSVAIGKLIIERMFSQYFAEIESVKVLSTELGWVKVRESTSFLCQVWKLQSFQRFLTIAALLTVSFKFLLLTLHFKFCILYPVCKRFSWILWPS